MLTELKKLAQSGDPSQQAKAQLPLSGHVFEVKDKGASMSPFILDDAAFRIQLAKPSKTLPMAYAKVAAAFLAHRPPQDAEAHLQGLLAQLGDLHERPNVSRIDLFVDFVSSVDMESWGRQAWVTRANSVNAYSVAGAFSGWSIGVGGSMGCRLYNKSLEHAQNGKDYLLPLWAEAGRKEGETVWRLEFEFKRESLTLKGLSKLEQVLANLNGLWSYATTEWLKLTEPNPADSTRSRWPVHPLWSHLASVDWETQGGPLANSYPDTRAPSDERLFSTGLSTLVSYMAREHIDDLYQGNEQFITDLYRFHDAKSARLGMSFDEYITGKLASKRRLFNTDLNDPGLIERLEAERVRKATQQYRKDSGG
ncbi:hypothetical protein [Chitinimonas sp. BJYL2]|uniref:hypothetical protein n=1 Tax=Chitinimonas sp. BJYL2 TaxID=2976696 RepID=UPI0022B5928A|nr:hypothetical protein [Chitinimonas sp. BJYL2]